MKQPSATALRVSHEELYAFASEALKRVDVPEESATMVARLLSINDLRGVLSHGTRLIARYVGEIRSGGVNPQPNVQVISETPNSLLIDGDGGLGYFPFYEGTLKAIEKAKAQGMAMVVTRNHGHIGAAGIYPRLAAAEDLCAFATSGVQLHLQPGSDVHCAAGGSPMCFAAPAGEAPPLVLDCGVTHDVQGRRSERREKLEQLAPGMVLRAIGFGTVCQAWGGLLTGLPIDPQRASDALPAANQGALLHVFDPSLFTDVERFKREMDEYAQRVRELKPISGTQGAYLPGAIEIEREQAFRRDGVPLDEHHQQGLQQVAEELGMNTPWQ